MTTEKLDTKIRKRQIAWATLELVAAAGISSLSVAAVAHRVGLVPSALYRHFKSKDEMLDAALDLIEELLKSNIEAARAGGGDALEQLHRLLLLHVKMVQDNRSIPQIVFSQDLFAGSPDRGSRVYRLIRGYLAEVAQIIRQGQGSRQVGSWVDAKAAATLFLGLIQPSAMLGVMSKGTFDVKAQVTGAWPLFRRAIAAEDAEGLRP
jgi:AcrR family transcriptional regulator